MPLVSDVSLGGGQLALLLSNGQSCLKGIARNCSLSEIFKGPGKERHIEILQLLYCEPSLHHCLCPASPHSFLGYSSLFGAGGAQSGLELPGPLTATKKTSEAVLE